MLERNTISGEGRCEYLVYSSTVFTFFDVDQVYGCDGRTAVDFHLSDNMIEDLCLRNLINQGRISYTFSWGDWTVRSFGTEDECPGYVCYYFDENGVECSEVFGEIVWQM